MIKDEGVTRHIRLMRRRNETGCERNMLRLLCIDGVNMMQGRGYGIT